EKDRRSVAAAALFFLVASLVAGMTYIPDSALPRGLWLAFGLAALVLMRMAFPDVWNYLFWLVLIYIFSFMGAISLMALPGIYPSAKFWLYLAGIFLELMALAIYMYLVLHVKGIRDEVAGIADKSSVSARVREEAFEKADYVPLGLWSMYVFMFFLFSNSSAAGLLRWAEGEGSLAMYTVSELLLISLAVLILWTVQTRFSWGERPEILPSLSSLVQPSSGEAPRRRKAPEKCPTCTTRVKVEKRMCRSCAKPRDFYWCTRSERYLIQCPGCRRFTHFGREECAHCGRELPGTFACGCGARHPPRKWPKVSGS
ncbi:MAG: hypothetical protein KAJ19_17720, partial [Gammaproteobacteria bacterium]|nr:hypothetical protein [Gammaproteobacteria bacterium]